MEKEFEKPELTIIYFEDDLATYDVLTTSGNLNDPWSPGDQN